MNDEHIGERAALYALNALDTQEFAAVQAHLAGCPDCAQLVGSAEGDVAAIASMQTNHRAPPQLHGRIERLLRPHAPGARPELFARMRWPQIAAFAAVLLVAILPSAYFWNESHGMHDAMLAQSAAMQRLTSGPHGTAAFRSQSGAAVATVAYAPDGSWYVVVVGNASKTMQVSWMHDGTQTMLGNAVPHGSIAMLYLPISHRMDRLALMDGERIVAQARLAWKRTAPNRPGDRSALPGAAPRGS